MPARIVVLGGGVGGTLAANLLSKNLGPDASITVVDPTGMHLYQPGFLYVALGEANGRWLSRDERLLLRRDVELAVEAAVKVDHAAGLVHLARGATLPYDYLVLATGARLMPEDVPGMLEAAHEFYSLDGALRLREALRTFDGGRIAIGIAGIPYKCPPAPVEFTLMLDSYLRKRGIRERSEITLLSPLNRAWFWFGLALHKVVNPRSAVLVRSMPRGTRHDTLDLSIRRCRRLVDSPCRGTGDGNSEHHVLGSINAGAPAIRSPSPHL